NRGLALASGEIVAFADDDVVVDRDWLAAIAEAFASGERVGCVTGLIAPAELDTPAQVMLEAHGGFGKGFLQHRYDLGRPEADPQFPFNAGKWGSGANMAFSAAALRGIGGFDRATGAGSLAKAGDELLAFFRIVVAGYGLVYQPDAVAWHTHPRTQDDLAARAFGHGTGLTAYLTAAVVHEPRMLPALLRRIPRGIGRRLAQPQTPPADGAEVWPRRLSALERRGLAYGPLAYARSRWHLRKVAAAPAALEPAARNPAAVDTAEASTGAAAPTTEEPAAAPRRRRNPLAVITRGGPLVRTGHLLTLSALLASVLGAGYWALATRLYSPESVGQSYAAVAALTFLSAIGDLSMGDVLTRFIATAGPHARRMVLRAYGVTTVATVAVATAFVLLVPHLVHALAFLHSPDVGAAFVVGCAAFTIFQLQDGALAGLRRPGCVVVENAGFAVVKIVCLFTIVVATTGILLSWIVALIAAVVGTNAYLFTRAIPRKQAATTASPTPVLRYTVASYTAALFGIAVVALPPLLVLNRLGPAQNAYFSLAWIVALALYTLNRSMGTSLVIESTWDPGMLRQQIRHMIRHTGALVIAGAAVLTAAAPWVLRIFGAAYEHNATGLFRLAVLSAVPDVIVVAASSACRARRKVGLLVVILGGLAVLVLGLTVVLLPVMGLAGIGAAWLIGQTAMAVALIAARSLWLPPRPPEELPVPPLADRRPGSTAAARESAVDAEPDDTDPGGAQPVTRWLGMLALPAALGLWIYSLQRVRPDRMTDLGLTSVLPVTFWAALGVLALGFVATLVRRPTASAWRAGYVLVLGTIMNATPALLYRTLSNGWAWQHVSITDYLAAHGSTAPNNGTLLDAYTQWPGFFALNAFILHMAGLHSALAYAAWAPPVFNTLMIVPLV
ncbi:MAG: glycosyltransferase, partial [Streptomyces sp.]|nr:glycosyltransferase [Streptomyces sp.]